MSIVNYLQPIADVLAHELGRQFSWVKAQRWFPARKVEIWDEASCTLCNTTQPCVAVDADDPWQTAFMCRNCLTQLLDFFLREVPIERPYSADD